MESKYDRLTETNKLVTSNKRANNANGRESYPGAGEHKVNTRRVSCMYIHTLAECPFSIDNDDYYVRTFSKLAVKRHALRSH